MNSPAHNDSANEARFLKLLAENRAKLLKICRVYAWERADQDDLYQEMLFQIWRALPHLRQPDCANTWLYRIALNTAIAFVRKDRKRRDRFTSVPDPAIHELPASQYSPDSLDRISQLHHAIAQLKPTEKAVITLFLEDLSYNEMAEVLGANENHVGVMLHRAKQKLSSLMKEAPCKTAK